MTTETNESRRERGKQRRREAAADRIVDTAVQILATDGFDALTVGRVASEHGYTIGALYRYFPSKDVLFLAVQTRVLMTAKADLLAALTRIEAHVLRAPSLDAGAVALLRLCAAAIAHRRFARDRPAFFALLSISLSDPRVLVPTDVGRGVLGPMGAITTEFARLLADCVRSGALEPGDAPQRAIVLWSAQQGALTLKKLERLLPELDADGVATEVVSAMLRGWGGSASAVRDLYRRAERIVEER